jgi:hypothetical protein
LLNAVLGWWWADPIAALIMVPIICKRKDKDLLLAVYISNDIVTGLEPATPCVTGRRCGLPSLRQT